MTTERYFGHQKGTLATPRFVAYVAQQFYQTLNMRETRRRLSELWFQIIYLRDCGAIFCPAAAGLSGP